MIGIFELLVVLAVAVIIGFTFWIWKSKPDWSTLKKVAVIILFAIGLIAITFVGLFMWVASTEVMQGMRIKEVNSPLNKFEYVGITEMELEEYPALKKAVEGHHFDMNYTEWQMTRNFLEKKWSGRSNQFVIDEKDLEEELNKSIVTVKMRNIFDSEGYPVPENSYIKHDGDMWYVMKIYSLFSITDSEVEKELNRFNMTAGRDTGGIVPAKLKNAFATSGFSLPEDARISGRDGGWVIDGRDGYTILKEEGKLNVYTGDEKTHEIRKDDGKLKIVYVGAQGSPVFKIREKYYRFEFWVS